MTRSLAPISRGFTLMELSIVLFIVALLVGGMLVPLATQYETAMVRDARRDLNEAREGLLGFVVSKRYFPCPATAATNGLEGPRDGTGDCTSSVGLLPWATLGTRRLDPWGRQYRYSISTADNLTNNLTPFGLSVSPTLSIHTRNAGGDVIVASAHSVVAVLMSVGRNGFGGTDGDGNNLPAPPASNLDEISDLAGTTFYDRPDTLDAGASGGAFDDILVWIPTTLVMNRMVEARQLP